MVIILGAEDRTATVGEPVQFRLDRRNAGYAELNVVAISPSGQDLPIEVAGVPGGEEDLIEFRPSVAGRYKLILTHGGQEVPGSPLVYTVHEGKNPTEVSGAGVKECPVGHTAPVVVSSSGSLIYTVEEEDDTPTVFGKGLTLGHVRDVSLFWRESLGWRCREGGPGHCCRRTRRRLGCIL